VLKRIIIILTILAGLSARALAQYDPSFSHYFDMETSFNAAAVGKQSKLNVTAAYALDLAGFTHNPQTAYASADMPFYAMKSYHGAGVMFMNDKIGLFTHQKLGLQYALKFKLLGGQMSLGVQVGLLSETFDGSKLDLEDSSDPAFSTTQAHWQLGRPRCGPLLYPWSLYVGASVQHANAPLVNLGEKNELQIARTYYLTGGYNIKMRESVFDNKALVLGSHRPGGVSSDITGRLVYTNDDKVMYGGIAYSPTNSVTVLLGGSFHGILLGYSYEFYTSAINPGNGSHELFIGYQHDINLVKKGKNKHKSVRLL
jgi:type IX secretion system PorP/SprF family membrane protein